MSSTQRAKVIPLRRKQKTSKEAVARLLSDRALRKTDYLVCGLQVNASNALFEEMKSMVHAEALARHFNIMRSIKTGQKHYRRSFNHSLEHAWACFLEGDEQSHILLPKGEVADWIDGRSNRTSNHYKVLLKEVRGRLQTLLGREVEEHPLLPDIYYRAFWQSLSRLDLTYAERRLLLLLFHRFVMDRYGQVVGLVNRAMINLKIDIAVQSPPTSSQ